MDLKRRSFDVKEEAQTQALEKFRAITEEAAKEVEIDSARIPLPKEREKLWAVLNPILLKLQGRETATYFLPIIRGDFENFSEEVYQSVRWYVEKLKREEGISLMEEYENEQGIIQAREIPPVRKKLVEDWISEKKNSPDVSANTLKVLKRAKEIWGNPAIKALIHHFLLGETEKEAAESAGITDRTVRNYILKLKKEFAGKK